MLSRVAPWRRPSLNNSRSSNLRTAHPLGVAGAAIWGGADAPVEAAAGSAAPVAAAAVSHRGCR